MGEAPRGDLPGPPADGTEIVCGLRVQQPGPILGLSPPHSQQLHLIPPRAPLPAGRMGANAEGTSSSSSVPPPFRHHHARLCSWLVANATQPWPVRGHKEGSGRRGPGLTVFALLALQALPRLSGQLPGPAPFPLPVLGVPLLVVRKAIYGGSGRSGAWGRGKGWPQHCPLGRLPLTTGEELAVRWVEVHVTDTGV